MGINRQWGSGAGRSARHKVGGEQLVGIAGQKVQAGGSRVVLAWWGGQEVWEEWMGQGMGQACSGGHRVGEEDQRIMGGNGAGCRGEGLPVGQEGGGRQGV